MDSNNLLETARLRAIAYADIFDYPLTLKEIKKFLIAKSDFKAKTDIDTDGEFYFLKGRGEIVGLRKKCAEWSKGKWKIAQKTAKKLKIIPLIKMIGVTGALSMNNADEDDDIDLMIITAADSLWLTRLLIILLAPILGIARRKPGEKKVKDKICFNLFLDESHLKIAPENLFLAHEICQVKPLSNKDQTYEKFLSANNWVKKYLPNAVSFSSNEAMKPCNNRLSIVILNKVAFWIQHQYMKPRITTEKISPHQAFFHPGNLGDKIQEEFEKRVKSLGEEGKS